MKQKQLENKEVKKILIEDLPIGISESGELVCIPKSPDPPKIGFCGGTGSGKSISMYGFADRLYWYWNYGVVWGNDLQGESTAHIKGMFGTPEFEERLLTLNEQPTGLPLMLCVPDSPEFFYDKEELFIKICLCYHNFLKQPSKFMALGALDKYLNELKDQLVSAPTAAEATEIFRKKHGNNKTMMDRASATFNLFYEEKLFDINSDGIPVIKIEGKEYNPLAACLLVGLVPSLYTVNLKDKDYFPNYYYNILSDIYNLQVTEGTEFKKRNFKIGVFIDEISTISEKGKTESAADKIINQCMRQGRFARIAVGWATQNISLVNTKVTANTSYLLAFSINEERDINTLRKNYNLPKYLADDIPGLKKFECIAMSREGFAIYDDQGNRRIDTEPRRMMCLPPLSYHKKPGE